MRISHASFRQSTQLEATTSETLAPSTPVGATLVTVTATSGTVPQSPVIALRVQ